MAGTNSWALAARRRHTCVPWTAGLSVDDVVRHGVVEEDGVLGDDGDRLRWRGGHNLYIDPIDQDLSSSDIEEPGNQVGKGRFPAPLLPTRATASLFSP